MLQQGGCWCPHPAEACPELSGCGEGGVGGPGAAVEAAQHIPGSGEQHTAGLQACDLANGLQDF